MRASIRALLTIAAAAVLCAGCSRQPAGAVPGEGGSSVEAAPTLDVVGTVRGAIHGTRVQLPNATFDGQLALFEGEGWGWNSSLLIFLFLDEGEIPQGRTFTVGPESGRRTSTPHIHYRWTEPDTGELASGVAMDGYRLTLQFGTVQQGRLPGRIDLAVPDEEIEIAGEFSANLE